MPDLLNPDDALHAILAHIARLPAESVALDDALARALAEPLIADGDLPPFDNSSLDGFAVRASDTIDAPLSLPLLLDIPAGAPPDHTLPAGAAARIMTGAPMPRGADAVVPVEATDQQFRPGDDAALPARVHIRTAVRPGNGVRLRGEDVHDGDTLLQAGTRLRPQDIGMLAAFGHARVQVIRRPRAVILSTGDELVEPGEPLAPGKIRDANGVALAALVRLYGGEPIRLPIIRDTIEDARARFSEALALQPDLIISSAGVSVGAFDVVRAVLEELGTMHFWRINLRPGKPLAFGRLGAADVPFFGLPGNPVSALVTFDVFVRPALLRMTGLPDAVPTVTAITDESFTSDGRRSYLRIHLWRKDGAWRARLTGTQSSGALSSMLEADGLLIVPEGMRDVPAGTLLPVRILRESALYYTGDNPPGIE